MRARANHFRPFVCRRGLVAASCTALLLLITLAARSESPCVITNEADTFLIRSTARNLSGHITLTWESCSDHLYEVQTAKDLSAQTIWTAQALMMGADGVTTWTDSNVASSGQYFYRVQRLRLAGDEDGDGVSNLDEFNRGTDLHMRDPNPDGMPDGWQPQFSLPASMIVGQTATLSVVGATESCTCQWTIFSGKGLFTNTVNCMTDFRPSWSGAVTVQVVCASAGVSYTNRARTAVAFPKLSPLFDWNDSGVVQLNNNCYNFSTDIRTGTFAQPGVAAGAPAVWPPHDCQPDTAGAIADGLRAGVDIDDLCRTSGLPEGHIIALLVWPDYDYHFVRLEADGTWSSKAGNLPATTLDNSGRPMTDPRKADLGGYRFCTFLWVGPNVRVR